MTDRKLPTQEMLENVRNRQCCQPAIAEGCYYIILAHERDALLFAAEERERLERALTMQQQDIQQTLARAIGGYPRFCDDQQNFPGATEADGVCVGEHVAESLALEAANVISTLRSRLAKIEEFLQWLNTHGGAYAWGDDETKIAHVYTIEEDEYMCSTLDVILHPEASDAE